MTSTITLDSELDQAEAFRKDLHARCSFYGRWRRNLECRWAASGYCSGCGRRMPKL